MDINKLFLMDNAIILFKLAFNKEDILAIDTTKDILHVVDKFKDTDLNHAHIMVLHQHDFLQQQSL